jgi:hypothetical protein
VRILLGAVVAVILLSGCVASPDPAPSSTPSLAAPTVTPIPTATEPASTGTIVVTSSALTIDDGSEPETSHTWFDAPAQTVRRLTELFGTAPAVSTREATDHRSAETDYAWNGFVFTVADFEPDVPYFPNQRLTVTSPVVHGVAVSTVSDLTVGSSVAEIDATGITEFFEASAPDGPGRMYGVDIVELVKDDGTIDYTRVYVFTSDTTGAVYRIVAPGKNNGV